MTGLSVVKSASYSASLMPCGCSEAGCSRIRSTTFTTRTRRSGALHPEDVRGREHLDGRHVTRAGEHHVRLALLLWPAAVVACPGPDPGAAGTVQHGLVDVQPLRRRVLSCDDDVDVGAAPQAVVGDREQAVRVRRQVDPDHLGLLVDHVVDEARVLVAEAVVVLAPDVGGDQVIQRGDRTSPRQLPADLQPLAIGERDRCCAREPRWRRGRNGGCGGSRSAARGGESGG